MKVKKTTVDNKQFIKPLIAKLPNWRYFFEILAKLGLIPTPNDWFDPIPRRENKTAKHAKPRSFFLT
jgi:hypothetical protein